MVNPNWGLLQPNQSMQYFDYGMRLGQAARERQDANELRKAEATLFANPNDQNALASYAQINPKGAFQYRQGQEQQAAQQQKANQEKALFVAKLFDGVTPENYGQRLAVAQRMGIPLDGVPQQYDPQWVAENGAIMRFVAEKPEAASAIGKEAVDAGYQPGTPEFNNFVKQRILVGDNKTLSVQPGGGVAVYNPNTGQVEFKIVPNTGTGPTGQPASPSAPKGPPKPGDVIGGYRFKGGNPNDRNSWEKAGGAGGNASSGFRPVSNGVSVIQQVFPNARVTSGYRGPDHPLSKKNPNSFHTKTRAAADIAPIPGMTFQQAKAQLEAAGYYVHPDSRDEVNDPSGHATGPHWHFVIGAR